MNSLITLRWNQGGRNVSSATIQRGGKITKSQFAVPGVSEGEVSTVKIDGSGWSKLTVPIVLKRARSYLYGRVVAVPGDHVERRMVERRAPTGGRRTSRPARTGPRGPRTPRRARGSRARSRGRSRRSGQLGQAERRAVVLADVAARRRRRAARRGSCTPRGTTRDLAGRDVEPPSSVTSAQRALLRHDQQLAVGVVEVAVAIERLAQ